MVDFSDEYIDRFGTIVYVIGFITGGCVGGVLGALLVYYLQKGFEMFDGPSDRGFWTVVLSIFFLGFACGGAAALLVYFLMS